LAVIKKNLPSELNKRVQSNGRGVVAIGSANVDFVIEVTRRPELGETILGRSYRIFTGGKGANQAVAAMRAGAEASIIACIGQGHWGNLLSSSLESEGVETRLIRTVPDQATGTAFITVTPDGENSIIVVPGANSALDESVIDDAKPAIAAAAVICVQMEIPLASVHRACDLARSANTLTVVTPGPALPEVRGILPKSDVLIPNLGEARTLVGDSHADPSTAATVLRQLGVGAVVITLGEQGVLVVDEQGNEVPIPALVVEDVVDTTAAGDTLAGVLAARLAFGDSLVEATKRAVVAAGISVTRRGAQASMPRASEIEDAV